MTQLDCFPLPKGPLSDGVGRVGGWQITSYFGNRIDPLRGVPSYHGGQDIAGAGIAEKPLHAVKAGFVSQGWDPGGGGNWTTLYTNEGPRFGYGHASRFADGVNGRQVAAGTVLAYVDSTGASTGAHLHFAYGPTKTSGYGDPFDLLQEAATAGRYPGTPNTATPPTAPEGLTMGQYEDIMSGIARLEQKLGTNLSLAGDWENDTRRIVVDGVEQLITRKAGETVEAGWSSRPYPFGFDGSPEQFWIDGQGQSRWIEDEADRTVLVRVLLNPHTQWFPAGTKAAVLGRHRIAGKVPAGYEQFAA
jgi:hypothetical protein